MLTRLALNSCPHVIHLALVSQSAGITGVSHCASPTHFLAFTIHPISKDSTQNFLVSNYQSWPFCYSSLSIVFNGENISACYVGTLQTLYNFEGLKGSHFWHPVLNIRAQGQELQRTCNMVIISWTNTLWNHIYRIWTRMDFTYNLLIIFFFFESESLSPGARLECSAVVRSWLTATSASRVQAILPQPLE